MKRNPLGHMVRSFFKNCDIGTKCAIVSQSCCYIQSCMACTMIGGGGYCPSTDSSDTFSGKCSSGAFQCIQFKMDGSTVRGVSKPSSEKEGLCSA